TLRGNARTQIANASTCVFSLVPFCSTYRSRNHRAFFLPSLLRPANRVSRRDVPKSRPMDHGASVGLFSLSTSLPVRQAGQSLCSPTDLSNLALFFDVRATFE